MAAVEEKIAGMSSVHVMLGDRYLGAVGLEHCLVHVRTAAIVRDCMLISGEAELARASDMIVAACTRSSTTRAVCGMFHRGDLDLML